MAKPQLRKNEVALPASRPNAGVAAAYRKRLERLVDEMGRSYMRWIKAAYRKNEPAMAMDATPAREIQRAIDELAERWRARFAEEAPDVAAHFAKGARGVSDRSLRKSLLDADLEVAFTMTPEMRDVLDATVEANVQLIRSIPEQFLTDVQGSVMRSVQTGRDLAQLSRDLQRHFGATRKRAAFIALDQNNKATSALQKVRQTEIGLEVGIWQHSHAGKEPRPTHLANDGKRFPIAEGWFDPDPRVRRRIMPGELPRCRCTWRPVVKGFS